MTDKEIRERTFELLNKALIPLATITPNLVKKLKATKRYKCLITAEEFQKKFPNIDIRTIYLSEKGIVFFNYEAYILSSPYDIANKSDYFLSAYEEIMENPTEYALCNVPSLSKWTAIPQSYLPAFCCLCAAKKTKNNYVFDDFIYSFCKMQRNPSEYLDDSMINAIASIRTNNEKEVLKRNLERDFFLARDVITVYRGQQLYSMDWKKSYAWTTDKNVAEWYAAHFGAEGENGKIITAMIPKEKIIWYCSNDSRKTTIFCPGDLTFIKEEIIPLAQEDDRVASLRDFLKSKETGSSYAFNGDYRSQDIADFAEYFGYHKKMYTGPLDGLISREEIENTLYEKGGVTKEDIDYLCEVQVLAGWEKLKIIYLEACVHKAQSLLYALLGELRWYVAFWDEEEQGFIDFEEEYYNTGNLALDYMPILVVGMKSKKPNINKMEAICQTFGLSFVDMTKLVALWNSIPDEEKDRVIDGELGHAFIRSYNGRHDHYKSPFGLLTYREGSIVKAGEKYDDKTKAIKYLREKYLPKELDGRAEAIEELIAMCKKVKDEDVKKKLLAQIEKIK